MTRSRPWHLPLILGLYFAVGLAYATQIPAWQAPDEPAHYNYVRQLAGGTLPVIAMGDYDQQLIERDVAPPNARPRTALDGLQYEDHQPPLFYALAAPIFAVTGGSLLALRVLSLVMGGLAIAFGYLAVREIFPAHPGVAALAAAIVALLPQHLHMLASLNNDALAEALLALAIWQSARLIRDAGNVSRAELIALGVTVGACFWTKTTAYLAAPVAAYAVWRTGWGQPAALRAGWSRVWRLALIAGIVGAPWWLRNLAVYGGTDVMGLQTHNAVVVGQPTTAEWLMRFGIGGLVGRLLQTTFQSFWGQFGWMSIVLDPKVYGLMLLFTAASAAVFAAWWLASRRAPAGPAIAQVTARQRYQLDMLALLALLTALAFVWYNLQFVQHQGRYLFPSLIACATAASLGWHYAAARRPHLERALWLIFALSFAALDALLLWRVILPGMR